MHFEGSDSFKKRPSTKSSRIRTMMFEGSMMLSVKWTVRSPSPEMELASRKTGLVEISESDTG
jgi:hypothetical protein